MKGQIFLHSFSIDDTSMPNFPICLRNIYSSNTDNEHTQIPVDLQ